MNGNAILMRGIYSWKTEQNLFNLFFRDQYVHWSVALSTSAHIMEICQ